MVLGELVDLSLFERLLELLFETPLDPDLELELFEFEPEFIAGEFERLELFSWVDVFPRVFVFALVFVFNLSLVAGLYVDSQFQIDLFFVLGLLLVVLTSEFNSSVLFVLSLPPL